MYWHGTRTLSVWPSWFGNVCRVVHLLFWDTTLPYYNRMILSKNGKSFIPISHKKSRTKIVMAPHTKFS